MAKPIKLHRKDDWMKHFKGTLPRSAKVGNPKPSGIAEDEIQSAVEDFLNLKGIRFLHIPDTLYRLCSPPVTIRLGNADLSWGVKNAIRDNLKGLPDILCFKSMPGKLGNNTLMLELKKLNAKARKIQLNWHRGLNVHLKDTIELAIELITKWENE